MRERTIRGLTAVNNRRDLALQSVKSSDSPRALDLHRNRNPIEISKETIVETDSSSIVYGKSVPYEYSREKPLSMASSV